jgi:hypothetical protein
MTKICSENEARKREYTFYLEAARGKQSASIDGALKAIDRFEDSTNRKPFLKFNVEQARSFRRRLSEEVGSHGQRLSAATITSTTKHVRDFILWLSQQPGYRTKLKASDASWFSPSAQDMRVAGARRERPIATMPEIVSVPTRMPSATAIERVASLPRLDLDELGDELEPLAAREPRQRLALRLDA